MNFEGTLLKSKKEKELKKFFVISNYGAETMPKVENCLTLTDSESFLRLREREFLTTFQTSETNKKKSSPSNIRLNKEVSEYDENFFALNSNKNYSRFKKDFETTINDEKTISSQKNINFEKKSKDNNPTDNMIANTREKLVKIRGEPFLNKSKSVKIKKKPFLYKNVAEKIIEKANSINSKVLINNIVDVYIARDTFLNQRNLDTKDQLQQIKEKSIKSLKEIANFDFKQEYEKKCLDIIEVNHKKCEIILEKNSKEGFCFNYFN